MNIKANARKGLDYQFLYDIHNSLLYAKTISDHKTLNIKNHNNSEGNK